MRRRERETERSKERARTYRVEVRVTAFRRVRQHLHNARLLLLLHLLSRPPYPHKAVHVYPLQSGD